MENKDDSTHQNGTSSEQSSESRNQFERYRKRYLDTTPWAGNVNAKLDMAAPYCFFLTRIEDCTDTYDEDLTITFPELLDSSLGPLEHSFHVNFMVETSWLLAQYLICGYQNPSITILYDSIDEVPKKLNLQAIRVRSPFPFGHHHTKMSIFFYKDKSLRIAIYTANLIESDWENRTQGVWISPRCPYLGDDIPINYGESDTLFKYELLKYLNSYRIPEIKDWLVRIQKANLSEIKVFLIPSIPGDVTEDSCGYRKLNKVLMNHAASSEHSTWDLVVQCSSIGSLGNNPKAWLEGEFGKNLCETEQWKYLTNVKLIYPSLDNVRQSHDGMEGGGCLPYQSSTHNKQLWLRDYVYQWKSNHRSRSKAVPHIKSYAKLSPDGRQLAWFLLTSANLSKAAWGREQANGKVKILSYELGVLFVPGQFIGKSSFSVKKGGNVTDDKEGFPVPYDTPITSYRDSDKMFLHDKCYEM